MTAQDAATRAGRAKKLFEELVALIPLEAVQYGTPTITIAHTLEVEVARIYQMFGGNRWPYQRIKVNGIEIGIAAPSLKYPDLVKVSWPSLGEEPIESCSRYVPPVELDPIQYETYVQLREDGVGVERAAILACELHPEEALQEG